MNKALTKKRLFSGEGWKPLDMKSVRQLCQGVKVFHHWDKYDIPSNQFYSHKPIPIQDLIGGEDFSEVVRGKVAVIGFYGEVSGRRYWVTKCQCGTFELISEKTLIKKPHSPQHECAVCRLAEAKRYQEECCDLAETNGLDFEVIRQQYRDKKNREGTGKRGSFGLIHFIRMQIREKL